MTLNCHISDYLLWVTLFSVVFVAPARGAQSESALEPMDGQQLSLQFEVHGGESTVRRATPSSLHWRGKDYSPSQGASLLVALIVDSATQDVDRRAALDALGGLGSRLQGMRCIEELIDVYPRLADLESKAGVLLCITKSGDPRGLPLLDTVLDTEKNDIVRLFAALGLARWNVRSGVEELLRLTSVTTPLRDDAMVGEEALKSLLALNRTKGWGISERAAQEAVGDSADDTKKLLHAWSEYLLVWYQMNSHRFPGWSARDPLPLPPGRGSGGNQEP